MVVVKGCCLLQLGDIIVKFTKSHTDLRKEKIKSKIRISKIILKN